jgi:hypothetical protein
MRIKACHVPILTIIIEPELLDSAGASSLREVKKRRKYGKSPQKNKTAGQVAIMHPPRNSFPLMRCCLP